ncbi:MAG: esterase family protein [Muribaculaceae bacterium]|nr:esterase family protein [Muribaculaceae bacterium]
MKKGFFLICLLFINYILNASNVDTVAVYSKCMDKEIGCVVISPDDKSVNHPTVYMLHGYGGYHKSWIIIKPELTELSDQYGMIFVCPNGEKSWYWDSTINENFKFETFITKELVEYIDSNYPTLKSRDSRGITGLSMGGQGALYLSIRHRDIFGVAGCTSGGVDIRDFPNSWDIKELIGEKSKNRKVWNEFSIFNQIENLNDGDLKLIIDCGYDDFFFKVNNNLHKKLLKLGISHDYIVRPGEHNLEYWYNSIEYQLLFFKNNLQFKEIVD